MKRKINFLLIGILTFSLLLSGCSCTKGKEDNKQSNEKSTTEKIPDDTLNSKEEMKEDQTQEGKKNETTEENNEKLEENKNTNQINEDNSSQNTETKEESKENSKEPPKAPPKETPHYDNSYFHEGAYIDERYVRLNVPEDYDITGTEIFLVNVYNLSKTSFDFNIYDLEDKLVFKDHTTQITGDNEFTYFGKAYTLVFKAEKDGSFYLTGFPSAEDKLRCYNNGYLKVG